MATPRQQGHDEDENDNDDDNDIDDDDDDHDDNHYNDEDQEQDKDDHYDYCYCHDKLHLRLPDYDIRGRDPRGSPMDKVARKPPQSCHSNTTN